ncbi:AN1-like Zinc finger [Trichuris suis]|nr:AN1-like Zinc finger [Trichuris suis]
MQGRRRGNKCDTLCVKCCSRDTPISKSGLCQKCTAASQKRDKDTVTEAVATKVGRNSGVRIELQGNSLPNSRVRESYENNGSPNTSGKRGKENHIDNSVSINEEESTKSESVHGTSTKNGQTVKNCSNNRCVMCGKKLGVIAFECYCGKAFCKMHRMPEDHKCTFDFKKLGREMVRKNNPKILPRKIEKL